MEGMRHPGQEKEVVEQPEVRRTGTTAPGGEDSPGDINGTSDDGHKIEQENSVYFDQNEGKWKCHHCIRTYKFGNPWLDNVHQKSFSHSSRDKNLGDVAIPKPEKAVINNQNGGNVKENIASVLDASTLRASSSRQEENTDTNGVTNKKIRTDMKEESYEEVIELEFERAVEKVHTHTLHCPQCDSQITKVVLRRKIRIPGDQLVTGGDRPDDEQDCLFGCLPCLRFFKLSGNCLKSIRIFGPKVTEEIRRTVEVKNTLGGAGVNPSTAALSSTNVDGSTAIKQGTTFDLFWMFRKGGKNGNATSSQGEDPVKDRGKGKNKEENSPDNSTGALHVPLLCKNSAGGGSQKPGLDPRTTPPHAVIDIKDGIETSKQAVTSVEGGHSKTLEIVKCIVHGGLMESIASLSVISSAAAADATTLNIITIGVASVISGLLIFGHNLTDLKKNDKSVMYQEQLGTSGHFLLHATFAILSFLVFGLTPPAVYGFTFYDSGNKDYKLLSVAAASFACVFILAIAKAYVRRQQEFSDYVKSILYYMTMAISVSGVAYAAGDLIKILMDRLGWFEPSPAATPAWTSY